MGKKRFGSCRVQMLLLGRRGPVDKARLSSFSQLEGVEREKIGCPFTHRVRSSMQQR